MSFKTWKQTIGYVFGEGIQAFEDGHFPTDFDITRRLIALIDEERKTYRFSPDVAISKLAKELVEYWENHSTLRIKPVKSIQLNLKRSFLPRLREIQINCNLKNEDQTYIERKQNEFGNVYDISDEKRKNSLEDPEYFDVSPTKKPKNDDEYQIPSDLDENEEKNDDDVDEDDPDYEYVEEEEDNDDELEKSKPKRRCTMNYSRATAAAIRFGISTRALCILIWAILTGKKFRKK